MIMYFFNYLTAILFCLKLPTRYSIASEVIRQNNDAYHYIRHWSANV